MTMRQTAFTAITGEPLPVNGEVNEFLSVLHDGTVLCKLANALAPNSVKKINNSTLPFKQMENISFFLAFAEKFVNKSELFQTVDLFERQDPNSVLICLAALARKSERVFGKSGLGPKEAEGAKKEWTSEQLRAGEAIIGLQMGSNKGANQSGMIMGNTRHM
uniref:Calponin n=1 Tax=Globodera rostochiensis TaxID=31243 RepID=A0A914GYK3_GLORO